MKIGKVSESVLKRSVLKELHFKREEVILSAQVGEDCGAVLFAEDEICVLSTDPITGATKDRGKLAILATFNDLASSGATPIGVLLSVLLPIHATEAELKELMKQMEEVCQSHQAQIIGGHTEVTPSVNQPIITVTGVGKVKKGKLMKTANAKPGMDLVVSKWIGLEGTAILAKEKEVELSKRFSPWFIGKAKEFDQYCSVLPEAATAIKSGVSAMHDVAEGGIFGALWEMAQASGVGLDIDLKKIPLKQETVEICDYFGLNPYELMSSGAMLMAAEDGNHLVRSLEQLNIPATIIGKVTDSNDRILHNGEEQRFLEPTKSDQLYTLMEAIK